MSHLRSETPACPVCARLGRAWAKIPLFERPQCLRCFRMEHGRPLLVTPHLPDDRMIRVRQPLTSRQADHRYRMLDHLRRQAQMAARRALEAAG